MTHILKLPSVQHAAVLGYVLFTFRDLARHVGDECTVTGLLEATSDLVDSAKNSTKEGDEIHLPLKPGQATVLDKIFTDVGNFFNEIAATRDGDDVDDVFDEVHTAILAVLEEDLPPEVTAPTEEQELPEEVASIVAKLKAIFGDEAVTVEVLG